MTASCSELIDFYNKTYFNCTLMFYAPKLHLFYFYNCYLFIIVTFYNNNNWRIYSAVIQYSKRFTSDYKFQQLRVLDSIVLHGGSHIWNIKKCTQCNRQATTPGLLPALFDKGMGTLKFLDTRSRDWTYGLTFLSWKTRKSNHLQMLE